MEAVNSAFISKLTWNLFYDNSLWVTQMQAKYSLSEGFLPLKPAPMILGSGNVYLIIVSNFGRGFGGRLGMDKTFVFGWITGVLRII